MNLESVRHAKKVLERAYELYFVTFTYILAVIGFFTGLISFGLLYALIVGEVPKLFFIALKIFDAGFYIGLVIAGIWAVCWILEKYVIPRKQKEFDQFIDVVAKKVREKNGKKK